MSADTHTASGDWIWTHPAPSGFPLSSRPFSAADEIGSLSFSYQGEFVPAAAQITGIVVEVRRRATPGAADAVLDGSVQLWVTEWTRRGLSADRSRRTPWPSQPEWITYGSPTDTWSRTWQPSEIVYDQFGLSMKVAHGAAPGTHTAVIDGLRFKIYYDNGGCD